MDAAQAGAGRGVGGPGAVVRDDHGQRTVGVPHGHRSGVGAAVPAHVGQRFGDSEVRRGLDRRVRPAGQVDVDRDRHRKAQRQRADRAVEPALGEHRRVDAADEVPQLDERRAAGHPRLGEQPAGRRRVLVDEFLRQADHHAERDEPGLGAVMQVTLDAPQLGCLRVDRVRAGHRQLSDAQPQLGSPRRAEEQPREAGVDPAQPRRHPQAPGEDDGALRQAEQSVADGLDGPADAIAVPAGAEPDPQRRQRQALEPVQRHRHADRPEGEPDDRTRHQPGQVAPGRRVRHGPPKALPTTGHGPLRNRMVRAGDEHTRARCQPALEVGPHPDHGHHPRHQRQAQERHRGQCQRDDGRDQQRQVGDRQTHRGQAGQHGAHAPADPSGHPLASTGTVHKLHCDRVCAGQRWCQHHR